MLADAAFNCCAWPYPADYVDEHGKILRRVARWNRPDGTKVIAQYRPDGPDRWIGDVKGVPHVPYRLPEVRAAIARGEWIFKLEGEKKARQFADLGFTATTADGGAGGWRPEHTWGLRGARHVALFPDNDGPGRADVYQVAHALHDAGVPDLRVVALPGLAEGEGPDNWLVRRRADGATDGELRAELERLVEATPPWQPAAEAEPPPPETSFQTTDIGNARRFVRDHGRDLRHVTAWRRWLVWDGVRWVPDTTAEVMRRAKATAVAIYLEVAQVSDDDSRKRLAGHAIRSQSERAIKAMVALAESELAVMPKQLDTDLWLLNVENGTLDLHTGELRPHERPDFITKLAPVRFDPAARHLVWDAFLARMVPDPEVRAFLQRAVGYSLTGDTSEERLFFVHGPTAAGKSTFAEAVKAALGDYAATCDFETFLRRRGDGGVRNDIARLAGVRMALSLEVDEGRHLAEGLVKNLTGGDVVTARYLYAEHFEYKPQFKLWLVANDKPRANAADGALWRRILLVPFEQSLPESERDPAVKATLTGDPAARAAILAWAVHGLRDWREHGLRPPAVVRLATDAYRAEQDMLAPFFSDCCIFEPGAWIASSALRQVYRSWCEVNCETSASENTFTRSLTRRSCRSEKRNRSRGWLGVRLRIDGDGRDTGDSTFAKILYKKDSLESSAKVPSPAVPGVPDYSARGVVDLAAIAERHSWEPLTPEARATAPQTPAASRSGPGRTVVPSGSQIAEKARPPGVPFDRGASS